MRNSIILVMILLATAALASDQAAHREVHPGATGSTRACTECHSCAQPTTAEPCLLDCPRHGGHFYGDHEVDEGPEVVVIDQLAEHYRPVVFAHKLHAGMADMNGGCTNCHHYSEESGTIPSCRECHDADKTKVSLGMPALKGAYHRQCINCHLDWSHENACGFCHEEANGVPADMPVDTTDIVGIPHPLITATETYTYETTHEDGPTVTFHHADHVDLFGTQCVDCHRGNSCARCHDTATSAQPKRLDHVVDCLSCHGERDCAFCHRSESMPRFNHSTSTGWELEPYHSKVECNTCHGDPKEFRTPTGQCADCHIHWELGSFDHRVTGLELSEEHVEFDCEDCHVDRAFHAQPTCDNCHDDPDMYPDMLPGEEVARKRR